MGSLALLQGIFPTQGSNPALPHGRRIFYQLSHQESLRTLEWVAYLPLDALIPTLQDLPGALPARSLLPTLRCASQWNA